MSNYDKLIKQATKPKPGAPKAKYIDPIIASSFSKDGSLQDICRALSKQLNDPSSLVVFKSLIVLHTMIRNGGIDNVMTHLAGNQSSLKLRNVVAGGNWQGYDAPKMLAHYAAYIDERIKAYRELRRDPIRASDPGLGSTNSEGSGSGHRLRKMTVEKGLLREVAVAQKVCSRLLDLFYAYLSDNTQDELALTAFRMSIKDLLAIYAAINEGVINILEHYFEMSKPDAERALDIYKRFCSHTEKFVASLASARKVSYSANVPLPKLRHAPVSLAGALKEYLDDPNFEANRAEYKANKRIVDAGGKPVQKAAVNDVKKEQGAGATKPRSSITIKEPTAEEKVKPVKPPTSNQALQDFFESIETEQMSMFPTGQQQQQQQQQYLQPFMTGMPQQMMPQSTGYNPFMNGGGFMMPQQTGFVQNQPTGFMQQPSQFMQPQQSGFLQPDMTGFNPFRQSVMTQPTGMNAFPSSFQNTGASSSTPAPPMASPSVATTSGAQSPFSSLSPPSSTATSQPSRSASAPIKPQKTGSRNPFAPPPGQTPPPTPPPAGPKGPSLRDLAMGGMGGTQGPSAGGGGSYGLGASAWAGNGDSQQQQQPFASSSQLLPQKTGLIGSIASEFVKGNPTNGNSDDQTRPLFQSSTSNFTTSLNTTPGSMAGQSPALQAPLQSQATGLGGSLVKPFQPSSTFGASLVSPPLPTLAPNMTGNPFAQMSLGTASSSTASPGPSARPPINAFNGSSNGNSFGSSLSTNNINGSNSLISSQTTGMPFTSSSNGVTPQFTGFGSSLFSSNANNNGFSGSSINNGTSSPLKPQATGLGGSTVKPFQPSSAFGSAAFGNTAT